MTPSRSWLPIVAWSLLLGAAFDCINSTLSSFIPGPIGTDAPPSLPSLIFSIITALLGLAGVPVLYMMQRQRARVLSLVGVVFLALVYLSMLALFAQVIPEVLGGGFSAQDSASGPPAGVFAAIIVLNVAGVIGLAIEGIAILRARVFPGTIAWMFFVGALSLAVSFFMEGMVSAIINLVGTIIIDLGLVWCAITALRLRPTTSENLQGQTLPSQQS